MAKASISLKIFQEMKIDGCLRSCFFSMLYYSRSWDKKELKIVAVFDTIRE